MNALIYKLMYLYITFRTKEALKKIVETLERMKYSNEYFDEDKFSDKIINFQSSF